MSPWFCGRLRKLGTYYENPLPYTAPSFVSIPLFNCMFRFLLLLSCGYDEVMERKIWMHHSFAPPHFVTHSPSRARICTFSLENVFSCFGDSFFVERAKRETVLKVSKSTSLTRRLLIMSLFSMSSVLGSLLRSYSHFHSFLSQFQCRLYWMSRYMTSFSVDQWDIRLGYILTRIWSLFPSLLFISLSFSYESTHTHAQPVIIETIVWAYLWF